MTLTNAINERYVRHCNREIWPNHNIILIILCLLITLGLSYLGKVEGKVLQVQGIVYAYTQGGSYNLYQSAQRNPDLCLLSQNKY